jgi:hypothetical protein
MAFTAVRPSRLATRSIPSTSSEAKQCKCLHRPRQAASPHTMLLGPPTTNTAHNCRCQQERAGPAGVPCTGTGTTLVACVVTRQQSAPSLAWHMHAYTPHSPSADRFMGFRHAKQALLYGSSHTHTHTHKNNVQQSHAYMPGICQRHPLATTCTRACDRHTHRLVTPAVPAQAAAAAATPSCPAGPQAGAVPPHSRWCHKRCEAVQLMVLLL